jgi:hypothetical protein
MFRQLFNDSSSSLVAGSCLTEGRGLGDQVDMHSSRSLSSQAGKIWARLQLQPMRWQCLLALSGGRFLGDRDSASRDSGTASSAGCLSSSQSHARRQERDGQRKRCIASLASGSLYKHIRIGKGHMQVSPSWLCWRERVVAMPSGSSISRAENSPTPWLIAIWLYGDGRGGVQRYWMIL